MLSLSSSAELKKQILTTWWSTPHSREVTSPPDTRWSLAWRDVGCGALHTPGFLSATLSLDYRTPKTQPFLLHGDTQTHNFEGISPLWPPLLGKEMKLFFFTSLKTLSPRFNSVLGYRGQVQLQYHSGDIKFWGILCHEPGTKIKYISISYYTSSQNHREY